MGDKKLIGKRRKKNKDSSVSVKRRNNRHVKKVSIESYAE